jgi:hypothetical protein
VSKYRGLTRFHEALTRSDVSRPAATMVVDQLSPDIGA